MSAGVDGGSLVEGGGNPQIAFTYIFFICFIYKVFFKCQTNQKFPHPPHLLPHDLTCLSRLGRPPYDI